MCFIKPTNFKGILLIPAITHIIGNLFYKRTLYWAILSIAILISACHEDIRSNKQVVKSSDSSAKKNEIYLDLKTILKSQNPKNIVTIQVRYDPYFRSPKKYLGYPVNKIIDSIVKLENFDTTKAIVAFECIDGYRPMMDFSKIFGETKGYIVYKDLSQQNGNDRADSIEAKFKPYYLVWDNIPKNDDSFVWPYGLIGLRLISNQIRYESVYPFKDTSLAEGFYLYRDYCMKCHSVNKVGGTVGPELNIPKNITEYWQEKDILLFVKNPGAYRYNSRMSAVTNIKDSDLKEIISYLKYLRDNKLTK